MYELIVDINKSNGFYGRRLNLIYEWFGGWCIRALRLLCNQVKHWLIECHKSGLVISNNSARERTTVNRSNRLDYAIVSVKKKKNIKCKQYTLNCCNGARKFVIDLYTGQPSEDGEYTTMTQSSNWITFSGQIEKKKYFINEINKRVHSFGLVHSSDINLMHNYSQWISIHVCLPDHSV